ncbi:hypothetical protein Mapa_017343 [Marchantia paleacea]|nr:hypothetical protein Mapa_017343 [Marchantia paleacea]
MSRVTALLLLLPLLQLLSSLPAQLSFPLGCYSLPFPSIPFPRLVPSPRPPARLLACVGCELSSSCSHLMGPIDLSAAGCWLRVRVSVSIAVVAADLLASGKRKGRPHGMRPINQSTHPRTIHSFLSLCLNSLSAQKRGL